MATDFYLTLPSNASIKMYPNNTLAHYITDLPRRIDLTGEWECGLAEIQYPHTWYNIGMYDTWFFLNETIAMGLTPSAKISAGYYKSPMTLMNHVNKGLNTMGTDKVRAKLSYSTITQKMTLHMTPGTEFTIPQCVGKNVRIRTVGGQQSVIGSIGRTIITSINYVSNNNSSSSSREDKHGREPETRWKEYRSHTVGCRVFATQRDSR